MTGCVVVNRPLQRKAGKCGDCSGEGHAGIMQGAGEAEQQSARSTAAQIFFWQKPFAASQPLPRAQVFRRLLGQDTIFDTVIASAYGMAIVGLLLI